MQQFFLVAADCVMTVRITHDAIHGAGNVPGAYVADNGAIVGRQARRLLREPIMVLDHRLDTAIRWKMDSDLFKLAPWIAQEGQIVLDRVLPEVQVEGLLAQIGRAGGEVNNFSRHVESPVFDESTCNPAQCGDWSEYTPP